MKGFGPTGSRLSTNKFDRKRDAYSATDIQAVILGTDKITKETVITKLGDIQTLSYSIHKDLGAVRTLGRSAAAGYTQGTRTIAGSLIFATFNTRALQELYTGAQNNLTSGDIRGNQEILSDAKVLRPSDTILPFDIILYFASENGNDSVMSLHRIQISDEGQTFSVQDIYTEHTMQFVASNISMMEKIQDKWQKGIVAPAQAFSNAGLIRRSTAQGFSDLV